VCTLHHFWIGVSAQCGHLGKCQNCSKRSTISAFLYNSLSLNFEFYCARNIRKHLHAIIGHKLSCRTCLAPERFKTKKGCAPLLLIHSFILSGFFYSASSSPLLLRGAPDYSIDTVSELTGQSVAGNCEWRTCPRSYASAGVGFEPETQGTELTTEPPRLTIRWSYSDYSCSWMLGLQT